MEDGLAGTKRSLAEFWSSAEARVRRLLKRPSLRCRGVCPVCGDATTFEAYDDWLRDHLICRRCRSIPRERAMMAVLNDLRPNWRQLTVHESSPSGRFSEAFARQCEHYLGTHYDPSVESGGLIPGLNMQCQDLEHQSFPDGAFDIVITQDVFEHLFSPDLAIKEIARTLRPGGLYISTVPLLSKSGSSRRRAVRRDGRIDHLLPPEHHHNPVDPEGSLVTVDWSYDIAGYFYEHGGLSTAIIDIDDLSRGIRGKLNEVVVAQKLASPIL